MTKYVNTNLLLIDFKNIFMPVFHGISYVGVIKCGVDAVYVRAVEALYTNITMHHKDRVKTI